MDERGLGGTYMIQQQFLNMYRRMQSAGKTIDNDPPATSMFRRNTYQQFGDYWKRIQPTQIPGVESKVDHHPPVSYHLLEGLYINRPPEKIYIPAHEVNNPKFRKQQRPGSSSPRGPSSAAGGGASSRGVSKGTGTHSSRGTGTLSYTSATVTDAHRAAAMEGLAGEGMPESLVEYLASIEARKGEVEEAREKIRRRRLLRSQLDAADAAERQDGAAEAAAGLLHLLRERDTASVLLPHPQSQEEQEPVSQPGGGGGAAVAASTEWPFRASEDGAEPEPIAVPLLSSHDGPLSSLGSAVLQQPRQSHTPESIPRRASSTKLAQDATNVASSSGSPMIRPISGSGRRASRITIAKEEGQFGPKLNKELLAVTAPRRVSFRKPAGEATQPHHHHANGEGGTAGGGGLARKDSLACESLLSPTFLLMESHEGSPVHPPHMPISPRPPAALFQQQPNAPIPFPAALAPHAPTDRKNVTNGSSRPGASAAATFPSIQQSTSTVSSSMAGGFFSPMYATETLNNTNNPHSVRRVVGLMTRYEADEDPFADR